MTTMHHRADAHIHLFEGGYQGGSFAARPGVLIDEAACYESLAKEHDVEAALVVGFAEQPWCTGNNAYLARVAKEYRWVKPAAYVDPANAPDVEQLEQWRQQGFVGISLYIVNEQRVDGLRHLPDSFWSWMITHRWLVSVNSRGKNWAAWLPILQRHGDLRMLISHHGLPPAVKLAPSDQHAKEALADVLALAAFPGPRVKLSGYYALSDPRHDYPHTSAWPYTHALLERFTPARALWASDFSPCLDWLTFPQTYDLFRKMPFLREADRHRVEGDNLTTLLSQVVR